MTDQVPYEGPIRDLRSFDWALSDHEVGVVYRRESITGRELYEAVYIEGEQWNALSSDTQEFYVQRAEALSTDPEGER